MEQPERVWPQRAWQPAAVLVECKAQEQPERERQAREPAAVPVGHRVQVRVDQAREPVVVA